MFGILGWLGMTYWKLTKRNIFIPLILLLSLAFGLEIIQYFIPWRAFNINDLVANEVGVTCGTFCFIIFKKISYFNLTPKDNL
jgi:VanZ family protein